MVTTALAAPTVLGLDLSLSRTGVAGNAGHGWADVIAPPVRLRGHDRLAWIQAEITNLYLTRVDLVVVEGPSYGNQGSARQAGHHERAGLWWLITHHLWARGTPVAVMPPASLKKWATGRGNAGKDEIMREVARRYPWFQGDNNAADALCLAAAGAHHLDAPMAVLPATHTAALAAVQWPETVNT